MPEVDVIIPAYNAAKYLADAIESVVAQTFKDWRILLVDDGSTDSTPEVAAPFIERLGPRLKYIRQANAGLPAARNTAILNSSAEFLALLDADDIWLPHRLAESVKSFANRPEVGLSYGFNARVDPNGKVIDTFARRQRHAEGWIAPYIYMRKVDLHLSHDHVPQALRRRGRFVRRDPAGHGRPRSLGPDRLAVSGCACAHGHCALQNVTRFHVGRSRTHADRPVALHRKTLRLARLRPDRAARCPEPDLSPARRSAGVAPATVAGPQELSASVGALSAGV